MERALISAVIGAFISCNAFGDERVTRTKYGDIWYTDGNVTVTSTGYVKVGEMELTDKTNLVNQGVIDAQINVCDGCDLVFQNTGDFFGRIVLGKGATFTQIVHSALDMGALDVSGPFSLHVASTDCLALADIVAIGASDIRITDTQLWIDADMIANMPRIEIEGDIAIFIDNWTAFNEMPLIYNVHGDASVDIFEINPNPMYRLESYMENDALFALRVRETDYVKILRDSSGVFLNALRAGGYDDKLLRRLDAAKDMDGLRSVMRRSVRLNPIKLMDTVRVMDSMMLSDGEMMRDGHLGAGPLYMFGDDYYTYGGNLDAGIRVTDGLFIGGGIYAGISEYEDDINEYCATVYGMNLRARYDFHNLFARLGVGASYARFDSGPVLNGDKVVFNPKGHEIFGAADIGANFALVGNLRISPFVGINMSDASVLDASDSVMNGRGGAELTLDTVMLGMKYDYGFRADMDTANQISAMLHMSVTSDEDGAGLYAGAGVMRGDLGTTFRISFTASLKF